MTRHLELGQRPQSIAKRPDRLVGSSILHGRVFLRREGLAKLGHSENGQQYRIMPQEDARETMYLWPDTPARIIPGKNAKIVITSLTLKRGLLTRTPIFADPNRIRVHRPVRLTMIEDKNHHIVGFSYGRLFRRRVDLPEGPLLIAGTVGPLERPSRYQSNAEYGSYIPKESTNAETVRLRGLDGYQLAMKKLADGSVAVENLVNIESLVNSVSNIVIEVPTPQQTA